MKNIDDIIENHAQTNFMIGIGYIKDYCKTLEKQNEVLIKAMNFINDTAPPLYKYNEVELRMILKAREVLEKIKDMK